jgi:hypothetical protein
MLPWIKVTPATTALLGQENPAYSWIITAMDADNYQATLLPAVDEPPPNFPS